MKARLWEIARSEPGRRFQDLHQRRHRDRTRFMIVLRISAGIVLVIGGIVLSMPPLVPGFLVTLSGLVLIASQSRRVARWIDAAECRLRNLYKRL